MMKQMLGGVVAVSMMSGVAYAGDWAERCVAKLEAEGRDTSGCQCLEDAINENPALADEFDALEAIDDPAARYDAASDEAKAAMDTCTRG